VHPTLACRRPPFGVPDEVRGDLRVVPDDITLSRPGFRVENVVEVREAQTPVADCHQLRFRHEITVMRVRVEACSGVSGEGWLLMQPKLKPRPVSSTALRCSLGQLGQTA
jgi:hypothetical protein